MREAPRPKMRFSERSSVVMLLSEAKRERQRTGQALSPKDSREEPSRDFLATSSSKYVGRGEAAH